MATIKPYFLKDGSKRYMVRYYTPDRDQAMKRGFRTKRDAEDWSANNAVKMNTGEWRPDSAGKITVNQAAEEWLKIKKSSVAPKTHAGYSDSVRHIKAVGKLGKKRLRDVTSSGVETWLAELGETVSPKTVRNSYGVLNQVMKRAVRDRQIVANPCTGVDLPKVQPKEIVVVPVEDVEKIAVAAGGYGDVVRFLAMTGLRWGEMAGLQVGDVNIKRRRIHVQRQITESNGTLLHGLPKHGKKRLVPMVDQVVAIVQGRCEGRKNTDLVFTTGRGTPLRNQNARRDWFDDAVEEAGYPGLTPHELRHSFASTAISSGASIKALQHALGHASAGFTLSIYSHMFPDDFDSFIGDMSRRFTPKSDHEGDHGPEKEERSGTGNSA